MDSEPRRWIAALRASHDRLVALARPLSSEELNWPSYDSQWSIAQVLSHLGSQTEIFSMALNAAIEDRDPPGSEAFPPIWDGWNSRTADQQSADSLEINEAFVQRLEALSDDQLGTMRVPMFGMDLDAVGLLRMRLSEHAAHTWDVAVALDPGAELSPDAVELLVDGLAALAARIGKPDGSPLRLRVVTSEPERDLLLSVSEEVRLGDWESGEVDGVVRTPAAAFLRLVYGRLDDAHMPGVEIEGPSGTLEELRRVFPGF